MIIRLTLGPDTAALSSIIPILMKTAKDNGMVTEGLVTEVFDKLLTALAAEADASILSVRLTPCESCIWRPNADSPSRVLAWLPDAVLPVSLGLACGVLGRPLLAAAHRRSRPAPMLTPVCCESGTARKSVSDCAFSWPTVKRVTRRGGSWAPARGLGAEALTLALSHASPPSRRHPRPRAGQLPSLGARGPKEGVREPGCRYRGPAATPGREES